MVEKLLWFINRYSVEGILLIGAGASIIMVSNLLFLMTLLWKANRKVPAAKSMLCLLTGLVVWATLSLGADILRVFIFQVIRTQMHVVYLGLDNIARLFLYLMIYESVRIIGEKPSKKR